ncbi:hypothetical protein [Rhizobium azibense]|uniref:Uncharacterized protein n=1 Tax=Rhizobium azibense TaxID=1136135 RepID=A0A4R3REW1_9HYPH|nr:hypothetical protein [Rhizobium azibense]TCU34073.1 hypothetical protein EV129_11356 [Rhizobium azibense]
MASLDDFPISDVLRFVRKMADKSWDKDGRLYEDVISCLPIQEARLVGAAAKWIDVLLIAEVKNDPTNEFSIDEIQWMLREKTYEMKQQSGDEKLLGLCGRELRMMMELEIHFDRYAMRGSQSGSSKSRSNWKKGKKN